MDDLFCANTRRIVLSVLCLAVLSCTGYYIIPERLTLPRENKNSALEGITKLYIESFTGRDSTRLLPIFFDEIKKRGIHDIVVELSESGKQHTGILTLHVREVIYVEDKITTAPPKANQEILEPGGVITINLTELPEAVRKNSAVSIDFSIRRYSDNVMLYKNTLGRTFQQVYGNPISIGSRKDADYEVDRLSRLIFSSFAEKIDTVSTEISIALEKGISYDGEYRRYIYVDGNATIVKGLRYAEGQIWDLAVLTWLGAAYQPYENENDDIVRINRASAFFNVGQIFRLNGRWEKAADMFSKANLSYPQLHYAQFWSDMIIKQKLKKKNAASEADSLRPNDKKTIITLNRAMIKEDEKLYHLDSSDNATKTRKFDRRLILRKDVLYDQINDI